MRLVTYSTLLKLVDASHTLCHHLFLGLAGIYMQHLKTSKPLLIVYMQFFFLYSIQKPPHLSAVP